MKLSSVWKSRTRWLIFCDFVVQAHNLMMVAPQFLMALRILLLKMHILASIGLDVAVLRVARSHGCCHRPTTLIRVCHVSASFALDTNL